METGTIKPCIKQGVMGNYSKCCYELQTWRHRMTTGFGKMYGGEESETISRDM